MQGCQEHTCDALVSILCFLPGEFRNLQIISHWGRNFRSAQRVQYPLIKEYTLNYKGLHIMIYMLYSLIKGCWAFWVVPNLGLGGPGIQLQTPHPKALNCVLCRYI